MITQKRLKQLFSYNGKCLIWKTVRSGRSKAGGIDGDKTNNRLDNLRACTVQQNNLNAKINKLSKSGIKGVIWDKNKRLWRARIRINYKETSLGCFWDKEVAAQVVRIERVKYHGKFANHG